MAIEERRKKVLVVRQVDDGKRLVDCHPPTGNVLGCRLPVGIGLKEHGWEWRCNANEPKLRQITDSYLELGFEVRTEPLDLHALSDNCAGCKEMLGDSVAVFVKQSR
ncbi:hypothetical protein [Thauera chlorobenzoica]|uniref:hypothetical protein n=1 Tax=Thauera chlorobenzoica TaxID=96773 RepID=UPI0012F4D31A|nr:hypothetical protein [Thauera chlorobenzoica]